MGIKDTNEQLVSVTLRALADVIPVLGAAAVIGGKRGKLFSDGRPKVSWLHSLSQIVATFILLDISFQWYFSSVMVNFIKICYIF